ncbi:MAG: tRNA pseudouridine(13) synthase TruD [Planctomycetota bacterium]|nr:tRNA pseudouridine(13) synthase TruD [Planctomycetota bacterium]
MRIKSKPQDFRVYELLVDGYVGDKGKYRVYRVTKKKLTSLEAASELALATGVRSSDIGMAGMKDRQGVTTQFMSVRGGKPVRFQSPSLKVEMAGFAMHALSSRDSIGNGFEIALRGVEPAERAEIEREAVYVRDLGVPNYFGEQRFGNLRHGQGWVAKELALGRAESALQHLLASPSENDNPHMRSFKRGLASAWGDWKRCRDVAGAYGAHHSIFEHLAREPDDFAGAFRYVKTEVRLIHLYAFQSHIWNRAVARFIGESARPKDRLVVPSLEGPLSFTRAPLAVPEAWKGNFRMPGEGLEDVEHDDQRRWLTAALAAEGLAPEDFRIHGVPGFAIKGEDRQLLVHPRRLEIAPDRRSDGVLHVSFDLPRGSYATLVLARLAPTREAETPDDAARRLARREAEQGDFRRDEERRPEGGRYAGPPARRGGPAAFDRPAQGPSDSRGRGAGGTRAHGPKARGTDAAKPAARQRDDRGPDRGRRTR